MVFIILHFTLLHLTGNLYLVDLTFTAKPLQGIMQLVLKSVD